MENGAVRLIVQSFSTHLSIWARIIYCATEQYWLTIHNSISKICPKCQVLSFHFSEARSMSCSMSIELFSAVERREQFQLQSMRIWFYVSCNNMYRSEKWFAIKKSGISCLALISNLSNPRMVILHAKNWSKLTRYDKLYTIFIWYVKTNLWLSG